MWIFSKLTDSGADGQSMTQQTYQGWNWLEFGHLSCMRIPSLQSPPSHMVPRASQELSLRVSLWASLSMALTTLSTPHSLAKMKQWNHTKKSLNQPDYSYTLFWRMVFLELSACIKAILTGQKTLFLCIISFSFYPPSTLGIEPGLISHVCKTCACYGTTSLNPPTACALSG